MRADRSRPHRRLAWSRGLACGLGCLLAWWLTAEVAQAAARVLVDDRGTRIELPAGRLRIVSLAPHATELLAAAGAGDQLVAVDTDSDQPPFVRSLPRVSAYPAADPEALAAWRPDLVVVWGAGVRADRLDGWRAMGLRVFVSEPRRLADIAHTWERLAVLAARPDDARDAARQWAGRLEALAIRWRDAPPVPVFVQLAARPLITLTDRDPLAESLRLCGARNVFGDAPGVAPTVGVEAVLARGPAMILSLDPADGREPWRTLRVLEAAHAIAHAHVDPAAQRPGPRSLSFVASICDVVDAVRTSRRPGVSTRTLR